MTYEMPELRLVGAANTVVLGQSKKFRGPSLIEYQLESFNEYNNEVEKEW